MKGLLVAASLSAILAAAETLPAAIDVDPSQSWYVAFINCGR
jgi:hypothetical protein